MALERFEKAAEILEFEHKRRLLKRAAPLGVLSWNAAF